MVRAREQCNFARHMADVELNRVEVLLVGLPRFYEALLQREFGADSRVYVRQLTDTDGLTSSAGELDSVIVVAASAASLRRAADFVSRSARILGTIAVTDEEPRGDVYLVSPAGTNVSHQELAQVIRRILARAQVTRGSSNTPTVTPHLIRSDS